MAKIFYLQRKHLPIERCDYEASAMLGLCDAASKFNPDYGVEFKNFSYYRIYGEMCDSLRKGGWNLIKDKKEQENEDSEEGLKVKSKEQEVSNLTHSANQLGFSLYLHGQGEEDYKAELGYADQESPEDEIIKKDLKKFILELLKVLPLRERKIIEYYYFENMTFEDMRIHFQNATKSWLCKLHKKAIKLLQEQIVKSQLKEETKEMLTLSFC